MSRLLRMEKERKSLKTLLQVAVCRGLSQRVADGCRRLQTVADGQKIELAPEVGLEPTPERCNQSDLRGKTHKGTHTPSAEIKTQDIPVDLQRVSRAWPSLPRGLRKAVPAIIESAEVGR